MSRKTVSVAYEDPRFSKKEALYFSHVRRALDEMGAPNSGELLHNSKSYVEGVYKAGLPALETAAVIWHKHCHAAGSAALPCVTEDREPVAAFDPWVLLEPGFWEWKTTKYPPGGYAIAQLPRKKGFELGRWDSTVGRVSFRAIAVYPSLESAQAGAAVYAQQPGGMEQAVAEEDKKSGFTWHETAPGTGAARSDTHGYTAHGWFGEYHIFAPSSKNGGYRVMWANTTGRNFGDKGVHGGLWHEVGEYRSPNEAKAAAVAHAKATLGGPLPGASECPCEIEESGAACPPNAPGASEKKKISHTELPKTALSKISASQRSYIDEFAFYDIGGGHYLAYYGHDTSPIAVWDGSSWSHPKKGFLSEEGASEARDSVSEASRLRTFKSKFKPGDRVWYTFAGPMFRKQGTVEAVRPNDGYVFVKFDSGETHMYAPERLNLGDPPTQAGEAAPACVPFTRLERNNEAFRACQAIAKGPLESDRDMFRLLSSQLGKEDQEVFVVVGLDLHRNLRSYTEIARGQRDRVSVNVEDVVRAVIADGPHGFVVAHNHPSGKANPSPKDKELTDRIRNAAAIACPSVVFLDHIVVGQGEYYCFADGKLKRG